MTGRSNPRRKAASARRKAADFAEESHPKWEYLLVDLDAPVLLELLDLVPDFGDLLGDLLVFFCIFSVFFLAATRPTSRTPPLKKRPTPQVIRRTNVHILSKLDGDGLPVVLSGLDSLGVDVGLERGFILRCLFARMRRYLKRTALPRVLGANRHELQFRPRMWYWADEIKNSRGYSRRFPNDLAIVTSPLTTSGALATPIAP